MLLMLLLLSLLLLLLLLLWLLQDAIGMALTVTITIYWPPFSTGTTLPNFLLQLPLVVMLDAHCTYH